MPLVLSTKILTPTQKKHLFLANLSLVEYNAVSILELETALDNASIENAIFTSQNAVKILYSNSITIKNAFCVGDKTAALLKQQGVDIVASATNAEILADEIVKNYSNRRYNFFCSKQRRKELPAILKANQIKLQEHHIYDSISNYKTFNNQFDAILCFSPLGVKSYYGTNKVKPLAICIGETTAKTAKEYTGQVIISNKTSIESVIIKAIKTLTV